MPSKPGQPQNWVRRNRFSCFCPGTSFFLLRAVSRENSQLAATSAETGAGHSICRDWETQGDKSQHLRDTTPEPALQHLAFDRRDWEKQGDKRETHPGRHAAGVTAEPASQYLASRQRETGGRHDPGASVTASGVRPQGLGDKRETRPRSQRHKGRQAGDTTPEPVTAFGIQTQGDKRAQQRHSIWHLTP